MNRILGLLCAALSGFSFVAADQTRSLENSFVVERGQAIELRGFSGSELTLSSWDKSEVRVKVQITIQSSSKEVENEVISGLALKPEGRPGSFSLLLDVPEAKFSGWKSLFRLFQGNYLRVEIKGDILVPRENPLRTDFSYGTMRLEKMIGEISVEGQNNTIEMKECETVRNVRNNYGTTTLERCGGNAQIMSTSGTVTVDHFSGPLMVSADYTAVTVRGALSKVAIRTSSGTVVAHSITGPLQIDADYSKIEVRDVPAAVRVKTSSGEVDVRNAGSVSIQAPYSKIRVQKIAGREGAAQIRGESETVWADSVSGGLNVENPYGTVELSNVRGDLFVRSTSGKVQMDNIVGSVRIETEYSTLTLWQMHTARLMLRNSSGPVRIALSVVPAELEIENAYGSVDVTMPKGFKGKVALEAEYSQIETNLGIEARKLGGSMYAARESGDKGRLRIATTSGNISLKEQ